jgi:hypothetical protein
MLAKLPRVKPASTRKIMKRFHEPLGMMIFCHQLLNEELAQIAWALVMADPSMVDALTSHVMSFEARVDIFSQLAHLRFRDKATSKRISGLVKELKGTNTERNRIVHGRWMGIPSDVLTITHYKTRSAKLAWSMHHYKPTDIHRIARRMYRLHRRLWRFGAFVARASKKAACIAK